MAWILVRLKITLLRAGLRATGLRGIWGAILTLLFALSFGMAGGLLFLGVRLLHGSAATDATAGAFAALLLIWVLGPVIVAGSEGTLEPDRLALFPLTLRQLMPGLLLAAIVGFGGITTVLILFGAVGGMAPASPLVLITVAAAASHLFLCAAASRLVGAAISGAVRSRRWRDVALFVGPVIALSLNVGLQVLLRAVSPGEGAPTSPVSATVRTAVRLLPSGPSALAIGYAREGRAQAALAALVASIALVVAAVALWGRLLRRLLTSSRAGRSPKRAGALIQGGNLGSLFPAWAAFLPRRRAGAVAAKELRLTWRDPRQRAAVLGALVGALAPALSIRLMSTGSPRVLLAAAAPAYMLGALASNQYGFDGAAHWTNVSAGDDPRADLLGKNIARALIALPIVVTVLVFLLSRSGSTRFLVPTVGLAIAAFGINLGLGNLASVLAPSPIPDNPSNVFSAGNSGQGLATAGPALAVFFGGVILLAPVLVPVLVADSHGVLTSAGAAGAAYGAVAWWWGLRLAAGRSATRQPELLASLTKAG